MSIDPNDMSDFRPGSAIRMYSQEYKKADYRPSKLRRFVHIEQRFPNRRYKVIDPGPPKGVEKCEPKWWEVWK